MARAALLAVAAMFPVCAQVGGYRFEESPDRLTASRPEYQLVLSRDNFSFRIERGGDIVFQTEPVPHSGSLASFAQYNGAVILNYKTDFGDPTLRVRVLPSADRVRFETWMLGMQGNLTPRIAFQLAPSGLWYGGGFQQGGRAPQTFPLNNAHLPRARFLADGDTQGTPFWYSTKGVAFWIRTPGDFTYSVNDGGNGLFTVEMPQASSISCDVLIAPDIREAVRRVTRDIGWPVSTPPADYFRLPIYTTWVEHKTAVSQAKVLEFAKAIRDHKLPAGVIEIDDKWEARYGDMQFDTAKFPDPRAMTAALHQMGFRVTLWIHPFVNVDSETFNSARMRPLLMSDVSGQPGLIGWWNGQAAVWDLTNPRAATEFRDRLTRLQKQYGFDGFKFDGGDVNLVPRDLRAAQQITAAEYPDIYNRQTAAHFPWEETRVGVYSQPLGVVQRLQDKQSVWGLENGLAATLPEAITVSLRGFAYVMPDMVGGNQYGQDKIDKELLIRWAQASALMPLLQFSVGAWHFDDECVRLVREASELHVEFAPYIIRLANAVPRTGDPILRPIWYEFPEDKEAQSITDEFMLGDGVVVAPVLAQGAVARDIYLPAGEWKEYRSGRNVSGGKWLRQWPAPLDTLPVFVKAGADLGIGGASAASR